MKCFGGRDRRGLTFVEIVISALIMLLVLAASYSVFVWTWSGFEKGDDAISAAHDASLLLMQIRKDLFRLELSAGEPVDLAIEPPGKPWRGYDIVASGASLRSSTSVGFPPSGGASCSFPIREGDSLERVTYTYLAATHAVRRRTSPGNAEKLFASPKLETFELRIGVQPADGAADLYLPADLPGAGLRIIQLWFDVRLRVQSQRQESQSTRTAVALSTMIFPKRANAKLRSQWEVE